MNDAQFMTREARSDAAYLTDAALCLKYAELPFVHKLCNIQAFYIRMRISGQSHSIAEILAMRKFPGVHGTDSGFMAGTHHQDDPIHHMRYQAAKAAGVDTNGKRYLASLARYPNDPEAWVSSRSDVLRICADRGWNCSGMVEHQAPETEPTPDIPIGEDILDQHVGACLEAFDEGERTPQLVADITERVTQELTGQIELEPELKVAAYDDPFGRPGM